MTDFASDPPRSRDRSTGTWHPVYCPLNAITGLEPEKERAIAVLNAYANGQRSVVLFALHNEWIYGQCNFKMSPKDKYNLKFVDTIETFVTRDLGMFAEGGVWQLLFVERALRDRIEDGANALLSGSSIRGIGVQKLNFRLVKE